MDRALPKVFHILDLASAPSGARCCPPRDWIRPAVGERSRRLGSGGARTRASCSAGRSRVVRQVARPGSKSNDRQGTALDTDAEFPNRTVTLLPRSEPRSVQIALLGTDNPSNHFRAGLRSDSRGVSGPCGQRRGGPLPRVASLTGEPI